MLRLKQIVLALWLAIYALFESLYAYARWLAGARPFATSVTSGDNPFNRAVLAKCTTLLDFRPLAWGQGALLQLYLAVMCPAPVITYRREMLAMEDGGKVALDWESDPDDDPTSPTLLILHGVAGHSQERYVRRMVAQMKAHGWHCVVYNRRGHGISKALTKSPMQQLRSLPRKGGPGDATPVHPSSPISPANGATQRPLHNAASFATAETASSGLSHAEPAASGTHAQHASGEELVELSLRVKAGGAHAQSDGETGEAGAVEVIARASDARPRTQAACPVGSSLTETFPRVIGAPTSTASRGEPPLNGSASDAQHRSGGASPRAGAPLCESVLRRSSSAHSAASDAVADAVRSREGAGLTPAEGVARDASSFEFAAPLADAVPLVGPAPAPGGQVMPGSALKDGGAPGNLDADGSPDSAATAAKAALIGPPEDVAQGTSRWPKLWALYCDVCDMVEVVTQIVRRRPRTSGLYAVGFSAGSNCLIKYVGDMGEFCPLHGAVSVANGYDLVHGMQFIAKRAPVMERMITLNLLKMYKSSEKDIEAHAPVQIAKKDVRAVKTIRQLDTVVTAKLYGLTDIDVYYRHSSCISVMSRVAVPLLCLNALDDPLIDTKLSKMGDTFAEANHNIISVLTSHGGHLGWVQGWRKQWTSGAVAEFLLAVHSERIRKKASENVEQTDDAVQPSQVLVGVNEEQPPPPGALSPTSSRQP